MVNTFTQPVIEINLKEHIKQLPVKPDDEVYIHVPFPYMRSLSFQLRRTPTSFGSTRPWLICPKCERSTMKLYTKSDVIVPEPIVCRNCLGLKYDSQFGEQTNLAKQERAQRKMEELQQNHLLSYGNGWTRYGRRFHELRKQAEELQLEMDLEWYNQQRINRLKTANLI